MHLKRQKTPKNWPIPRKGLVVLLDASLDVLKKVASDFSPGEELHRAISNYDAIHKAATNILPEGELEKINHRYEKIEGIWT